MINWIKNPDGEYNEHSAIIFGNTVTIYSDRDEEHWFYYINDGESVTLNATNLEQAKKETEHECKFS